MLVFELMGYVFQMQRYFLQITLFNIWGYYQEFVLLIPDLKMNIGLAFSFISIYQLKKKHFLLWEMLYLLHICRQQHWLIILFEFDNIWIRSISTVSAVICYLLFAAHQYSAALSRRGEYGLLKSPSCDFGLDYFPTYEDISYDPNVMIMIMMMIMNVHMMMIMMSVPGISQPPILFNYSPVCIWSPAEIKHDNNTDDDDKSNHIYSTYLIFR